MSTSLSKIKTTKSTRSSTKSVKSPKKTDIKDDEKALSQRECDEVYAGIKRWKAHDGAVLLPVVQKNTVVSLKERTRPKWWKKSGMSNLSRWNTPTLVLTSNWVCRQVDALHHNTSKSPA